MNDVIIKKANKKDLDEYYNLILERCEWFKENKINQWNYNYEKIFNKDYFYKNLNENHIFVAIKNNKVIGGIFLRDKDIYYKRKGNSFYLHHFVTKIGEKNIGDLLLNYAINYCKAKNKAYLRLDCISTNEFLNRYYLSKDFAFIKKGIKYNETYNLYEKVIK